jgi:hypothetical protein
MSVPQRYVSDELTHFVGRSQPDEEARYALLVKILQAGFLTSDPESPQAKNRLEGIVAYRYTPHAPFSDPETYSIDCVCFCDIPVPDLPLHMGKYGPFGIAFAKPFLIAKGANPAFYWAGNALARGRSRRAYLDDMVGHFHWLTDRLRADYPYPEDGTGAFGVRDRLDRVIDFVNQYVLCFIKIFDDTLPDEDPDNFYMEREWRVAGGVAFSLEDVQRIILPRAYAERLRRDVPGYFGQIQFAA